MSNIEEIDAGSDFVVGKDVVPDIMVVGVGGGGNNAINNMYKQNIKKAPRGVLFLFSHFPYRAAS